MSYEGRQKLRTMIMMIMVWMMSLYYTIIPSRMMLRWLVSPSREAGLDTLLVAPHNLGSTQLPFARVSSSLKFELFKMLLTSINFLTGCVAWFCLLRMKSWRASSGGAAMDSSFLFRLWPA